MDQYLAVLDPLEYNAKVARGVSWKLILLVWTLGFSAAAATSTQLVSAGERSPWTSCHEVAISKEAYQGWKWLVITSSAFFVAPVLILTCIYLRIFAAASKSSRGIRRNSFHQPLTKATEDDEEEEDVDQKDLQPDCKTIVSPTRNVSAPDLLSTAAEETKGSTKNIDTYSGPIVIYVFRP